MASGLKMLFYGACVGLAIAMTLGWFPPHHRNAWKAHQEEDWLTPEDRARAQDVPERWRVVQRRTVTVCAGRRIK